MTHDQSSSGGPKSPSELTEHERMTLLIIGGWLESVDRAAQLTRKAGEILLAADPDALLNHEHGKAILEGMPMVQEQVRRLVQQAHDDFLDGRATPLNTPSADMRRMDAEMVTHLQYCERMYAHVAETNGR